MTMLDTYKNITDRDADCAIKGKTFTVTGDCQNDYYKEQLAIIPAGTPIIADFAGEFGMYGIAEVDGAVHRVKVQLHELHKIDFGVFDARTSQVAA